MRKTGKRTGAWWCGAIATGLTLVLLAGCHKAEPVREDDGFANEVTEAPAPPVEIPKEAEPAPPPKRPEPDANVADALPAEEAPSPDAQMLEDADASGLTSRVAPAETGNETPGGSADGGGR